MPRPPSSLMGSNSTYMSVDIADREAISPLRSNAPLALVAAMDRVWKNPSADVPNNTAVVAFGFQLGLPESNRA